MSLSHAAAPRVLCSNSPTNSDILEGVYFAPMTRRRKIIVAAALVGLTVAFVDWANLEYRSQRHIPITDTRVLLSRIFDPPSSMTAMLNQPIYKSPRDTKWAAWWVFIEAVNAGLYATVAALIFRLFRKSNWRMIGWKKPGNTD
jgi:hypothetical protein